MRIKGKFDIPVFKKVLGAESCTREHLDLEISWILTRRLSFKERRLPNRRHARESTLPGLCSREHN
jgi:hypothetical protein